MAGQERVSSSQASREETATAVPEQDNTATSASSLDADVDSILDEIDSVLEENAEDFVKSFVQKGGQ